MTTERTDQVATPEQERAAAEAAFAAVDAASETQSPAQQAPQEKSAEAMSGPDATQTKETEKKEPDPWEGVHAVVRTAIEGITSKLGTLDTLSHEVRSTTGRIGAIQSELARARSAPADKSPTPAQVTEATKSSEKWNKLKEDFPEWGDAFDERFAAERAELLKQVAPKSVDIDGIKRDVTVTFADAIGQAEARAFKRARDFARIDAKHDDWEEMIRTPDFMNWAYVDGPTAEERQRHANLDNAAPEQAAAMLNDFVKRYPKWWSERGALIDSEKPADAIKLLDAYAEHRSAAAARAKKRVNLEAAIPAKGTTAQRQPTLSEREAAEKAFASA